MKKKIKKGNLPATERHFGVLLEDIDSKFDLVVEGHKALDKKIDKFGKNLADFKQDTQFKFKTLIEMTAKNTEDITKNTEGIETLVKMTAKNTENIEIIKSDTEFIKNSLKKKVDIDEFAFLEKRVALLERKLQRI